MHTAIPLPSGVADETAEVLARAFQDDPMMAYLMPDPDRRRTLLPRFLGGVQRYCVRYGEVFTTAGLDGVACWLPPGATEVTPRRLLRTRVVFDVLRLGPDGLNRFRHLIPAMERSHHSAMRTPHWYLWLLGAEPSRSRRGVGSALLAPALRRADEAGVPAYLETHNERNLAFYGRHGFAPVAEEVVNGVRYWGLRRPPHATA